MGNSVMLNGVEYAGEQIAYKDSTYELVSKVAYLIGVPLRIFQNEHEPPKIEIYDRLEQDKNARIIRNLCIIRTAIERNYRRINDIMRMEYRGLLSMPEIIPASSMQQLSNDGISFIKKSSTKLCHHIIEINRLISDRINNCKSLFPIWINWTYIKELFIMPNGLTEDGTKDAADIYYASLSYYPYQMYINWVPMDEGNVLYNDKKFATLLYQWHCDAFTEYSKVSDAGAFVKTISTTSLMTARRPYWWWTAKTPTRTSCVPRSKILIMRSCRKLRRSFSLMTYIPLRHGGFLKTTPASPLSIS